MFCCSPRSASRELCWNCAAGTDSHRAHVGTAGVSITGYSLIRRSRALIGVSLVAVTGRVSWQRGADGRREQPQGGSQNLKGANSSMDKDSERCPQRSPHSPRGMKAGKRRSNAKARGGAVWSCCDGQPNLGGLHGGRGSQETQTGSLCRGAGSEYQCDPRGHACWGSHGQVPAECPMLPW